MQNEEEEEIVVKSFSKRNQRKDTNSIVTRLIDFMVISFSYTAEFIIPEIGKTLQECLFKSD